MAKSINRGRIPGSVSADFSRRGGEGGGEGDGTRRLKNTAKIAADGFAAALALDDLGDGEKSPGGGTRRGRRRKERSDAVQFDEV